MAQGGCGKSYAGVFARAPVCSAPPRCGEGASRVQVGICRRRGLNIRRNPYHHSRQLLKLLRNIRPTPISADVRVFGGFLINNSASDIRVQLSVLHIRSVSLSHCASLHFTSAVYSRRGFQTVAFSTSWCGMLAICLQIWSNGTYLLSHVVIHYLHYQQSHLLSFLYCLLQAKNYSFH